MPFMAFRALFFLNRLILAAIYRPLFHSFKAENEVLELFLQPG